MKYFENVTNLDELKKAYRRLAQIHHPDCGGDVEIMKTINAEHDALFEILKAQHNARADEAHQTTESAEEFREVLEKLLVLGGLTIELCGCWLWVSGNTKAHREALKAAGLRWSSAKSSWYWRHQEDHKSYYRSRTTMHNIRSKYGSQVFNTNSRETAEHTKLSAMA